MAIAYLSIYILIFLSLISFSIYLIFRYKKYQKQFRHRNVLLKLVAKTTKSKFYLSKDEFEIQCKKILEELGVIFNLEYSCIGRVNDSKVSDIGFYLSNLSNSAKEVIHDSINYDIKDSIVASTLDNQNIKTKEYFGWCETENDEPFDLNWLKEFSNSNGKHVGSYESIVLESGAFRNLLFYGFYDTDVSKNLIGYLVVVNKRNKKNIITPFENYEKEFLSILSKNLSSQIYTHEHINTSNNDDIFINGLYSIDDIDILLKKILKYLAENFGSIVTSYWIHTKNGFDQNDRIIALRTMYPEKPFKEAWWPKELEKDYFINNGEISFENSFCGDVVNEINELPDTELPIKIVIRPKENSKLKWKEIPADYIVGIPIVNSSWKPILPSYPKDKIKTIRERNSNINKVRGVLCLQTNKLEITEEAVQRLENIATHIQILIEKTIYKDRYNQVLELNKNLDLLSIEMTEGEFYKHIVELTKRIINAEACSIFFSDLKEDYLYLKETTAQFAVNHERKIEVDIKKFKREKSPIYWLKNENGKLNDSISSTVYNEKTEVLYYNIYQSNTPVKLVFVEKTKTDHKSLIAIQIRDRNGIKIGVLRCINKDKKRQLYHNFSLGDLHFLELVVGILTSFIVYKRYDVNSRNKVETFLHENRGPVSGLQMNIELLKFYLNKGNLTGIQNKIGDMENEVSLIKLNTNAYINDSALKITGITQEYSEFKYKKVNLKKIIKNISLNIEDLTNEVLVRIPNEIELYLDFDRFSQIIYNLLINAKRYSYEYKPIKVYFKKTNHDYIIYFSNYGIGVPEGDESKIFDLDNFRSDNAKKFFESGSGKGLKISKFIIEKFGGKIGLYQNMNPTIFFISLPLTLGQKKPKQ